MVSFKHRFVWWDSVKCQVLDGVGVGGTETAEAKLKFIGKVRAYSTVFNYYRRELLSCVNVTELLQCYFTGTLVPYYMVAQMLSRSTGEDRITPKRAAEEKVTSEIILVRAIACTS